MPTRNQQADREVDAAVTYAFNDETLKVVLRRPYTVWEAAFVRRWGLPPLPEGFPDVVKYMASRGLDPMSLGVVEALQVFHVNKWLIDESKYDLYRAMERDYDVVPPELVDERTPEDLERLGRQDERLNPNPNPRQVFDMGKNQPDKLWKPGDR